MSFTNPDKNIEQINVQQGDHIVIFGSGAGGHSFAAARALSGTGHVYSLDVREDMLLKLKNDAMSQNLTNISVLHTNIESANGTLLEPDSKDVVIIPNTLFAYQNKPAILKEAFRILKSGAKLLIIDWRSSFAGMGPQPEDVISQAQATELATAAGFKFLQNISAGNYHWGCLYSKTAPSNPDQQTNAPSAIH